MSVLRITLLGVEIDPVGGTTILFCSAAEQVAQPVRLRFSGDHDRKAAKQFGSLVGSMLDLTLSPVEK